jgi:hypothetical protein
MNWEALGAIGQVFGSVATLAALGYLAVQVNHARNEGRRALTQHRSESVQSLWTLGLDERILAASARADEAFGFTSPNAFNSVLIDRGLSAEEAHLLFGSQLCWWTYRLSIVQQLGELPELERAEFIRATRRVYGQPGIPRLFYETFVKPTVHPDAVRRVEELLAAQWQFGSAVRSARFSTIAAPLQSPTRFRLSSGFRSMILLYGSIPTRAGF